MKDGFSNFVHHHIKSRNMKNLNKTELLQLQNDYQALLQELKWKLAKAERSISLKQNALTSFNQRLAKDRQRLMENEAVLEILSSSHPLRKKMEEDLYRTRFRIQRLESREEKFSMADLALLEAKVQALKSKINFYKNTLDEIAKQLRRQSMKVSKNEALDKGISLESPQALQQYETKGKGIVHLPLENQVQVLEAYVSN